MKPTLEPLEPRDVPAVSWPTFDVLPAAIAPAGQSSGFAGYHLPGDPYGVDHIISLWVSDTGLQTVVTDQVSLELMHWQFTVHNPVQVVTQADVSGASIAANPTTGEILVTWIHDGNVQSSTSMDGGESWAAPVLVGHDAQLQSTHATWVPDNTPVPTASDPMPGPGSEGHFTVRALDLPQQPDYAAIAAYFRLYEQHESGWQLA